MSYAATQWRKRLERKGWISLRRKAPALGVIEYHVIYRGHLYSGRCNASSLNGEDMLVAGTTEYLLRRTDLITEGVWRRAKNKTGEMGRVCRPWQY
ncbi:hypothetical protein [Vreelandella neptunia]|uniref:Uncharacterized protein n=1 Tax=Vreelandella neptunia TaxID=115551 RepID=A0ABZ0YSR1_9GAMM|nr:hypothetical protein [Halomonas neptunia]MDN3561733.1 hypothetical protein [Halomonas neptunia]WQH14634.1 hypothetical protein SR894_08865 [Halomonas neptunia]